MTVDPIDKNFSVIDGPPFYVRYGHVTSCIFGSFKIDTRGTGLIVDPTVRYLWNTYSFLYLLQFTYVDPHFTVTYSFATLKTMT